MCICILFYPVNNENNKGNGERSTHCLCELNPFKKSSTTVAYRPS